MGGCKSRPGVITMKAGCVRDKEYMQDIIMAIREVFRGDRWRRQEESGGNSLAMDEDEDAKHFVEIREAARDVGELGNLLNKIAEKKSKLADLRKSCRRCRRQR